MFSYIREVVFGIIAVALLFLAWDCGFGSVGDDSPCVSMCDGLGFGVSCIFAHGGFLVG